MATFQQAYDVVAARYSDNLWDRLNPSEFVHEIYQELRRMDAEAVAEKANPGTRAKRASTASI
jgi:hypothetical protein